MSDQGLVFEKLTQTIAANYEWKTLIAGDYLRIVASSYAVDIALIKNGRVIGKMRGMLAGDRVEGQDFDGVILTNGALQQDITIQICAGGAGSDRVIGEVSVIDGGKARSISGSAFWGVTYSPVVAASLPCAQLWNKSTTKNLVIESILITSAFSQIIHIIRNNAQLATLSNAPFSKYTINASSVNAELRTGTNAVKTAGDDFMVCAVVANTTFQITFKEPLVIKIGEGLVVQGFTNSTDIYANFEFIEDSI